MANVDADNKDKSRLTSETSKSLVFEKKCVCPATSTHVLSDSAVVKVPIVFECFQSMILSDGLMLQQHMKTPRRGPGLECFEGKIPGNICCSACLNAFYTGTGPA